MNKSPNKRWGKKLLLFFCVFISFLCVITIPNIYNKEVKAETTTIDDSPMGEKIVQMDMSSEVNSGFIGLSEKGEIYTWGTNILENAYNPSIALEFNTIPKKVTYLENGEEKVLSGIKQVGMGGFGIYVESQFASVYYYALKEDGTLYVWGDNRIGFLPLPEKKVYLYPEKANIDSNFRIKKFSIDVAQSFFISTDGEIYASGIDVNGAGLLGLDKGIYRADGLVKLTKDYYGNDLPKMIDAKPSGYAAYFLSEDGSLYSAGATGYTGAMPESEYDVNISRYDRPKHCVYEDGSLITDARDIIFEDFNGGREHAFIKTDRGVFTAIRSVEKSGNTTTKSSGKFHPIEQILTSLDTITQSVSRDLKSVSMGYGYSTIGAIGTHVVTNGNEVYTFGPVIITSILNGVLPSNVKVEATPYEDGTITSSYQKVKQVLSGRLNANGYVNILTLEGSVFSNGIKLGFGDIALSSQKQDHTLYENEEKYSDNVNLIYSLSQSAMDQVRYDVTDLSTNTTQTGNKGNGNIEIVATSERIHKTYTFYVDGMKDQLSKSITVDIFKQEPEINGLTDQTEYLKGQSFTYESYNGFAENTVNVTLSKNGGTAKPYSSGTAINDVGNYIMEIKDQYGNAKAYEFTVANLPSAQLIAFTPKDEQGLVYGNTITKKGNVIGTLSLKYANEGTTYQIKTIKVDTDAIKDGDKFEIVSTNQLKVKGSDLNAGTYVIPISGTDENDTAFSGDVEIVIAPVSYDLDWNDNSKLLKEQGLEYGKQAELGVIGLPDRLTVSYSLKNTNVCIAIDGNKITANCIPDPSTITLVATPTGDNNYKNDPIELEITIKNQKAKLSIAFLQENDTYKNEATIKIGDDIPNAQIISDDENLDLSTLGKPVFSYKKDGKPVASPMNETGTYTVTASYPAGTADNYDITWTNATLIVEDLIIDESNISDFVKLESDGKPYTQGTWTKDDIIITPVHPVFNLMDIDHAGTQSSSPYTYSIEGEHTVTLTFYTSEGAEVSTDVILYYDHTSPTISAFIYEDEPTLRSFLRTVTFDHFFGKAQQLSFTGSDEIGGSGIDHYRYEIVELDNDKNEKPASKKTGTLAQNKKLTLNINKSYRISAWAVDVAGNESDDEKIERVFLSDEAAQLNITATSGDKPYDGSKWTKGAIDITLSGTSNAGVSKYQYSENGIIFHDLVSNTITLPNPVSAMNNVPYTFRAINQDGTESDQVFYLKVDPVKPVITVKGSVNGSNYDGSATDQSIIITPSQTNQSISGITYYYTTNPSSKESDPLTDKNWKKYSSPITHSVNGTYTYYFKAISGAGMTSDPSELTVSLNKKEYTELQVNVTTEGKVYSPGNWAKHDITFTLSGGIKDPAQITGYEYTTTSGAKPNASADWKPVTDATLEVEENVIDRTYWFRVLPSDPDHRISKGTQVNLDVDQPAVPVLTMKYENTNAFAQLINTLSFGKWMNKEAVITMKSTDETSGIDHYEYEESSKTNSVTMKSKDGIIRYGDETEVIIRAKACDKAGNCSEFGDSEEVKVDMKAPSIIGVKDQSIYVQYYLPRFVSVKDDLSGIAQATYTKTGDSAIDIIGETKIEGEGIYQVYAKDEAGNEGTLQFKIVRLPYIETEIDGSDESREIIDQVIDELEDTRKKLDPDEIKEYERWIKEAEEKWDSLRRKVIETVDKAAKVEGQGDTTFDPNTELIVEEIPKDKVPVLPRNAIKTYDVYLRKGKDIVLPDGSVKVYLPYTEEEPPIVYEISEDGTFKELIAVKEGDYVTFITNTLKKYAISNEKQKENKPDPIPDPKPNPDNGKNDQVCVAGPDGKLGTADDVCGEGNGTKEPDKGSDGSVTVPDGGSVIFPNGNEVELPDGGIIKPDGSVELPDGTIINPDGTKKDDINVDTDNDGKPDINIDINGDGKPDINIDTDGDGVPDINIDTSGDGKPDYNIDTDGDQKADVNVGPLPKPWKPNTCHTINKVEYCTMNGLKPNINIDTNNDGIPDLNVDLNGDGSADLNIDTDFDGIPNIDIDTTGDGKPDLNIDRTGNGKADENIQEVTEWNPTDLVTVNGTTYGIMKSLYREPNIAPEPENPDSTPPTDNGQTKEPQPTPQPSVKGSYQSNVGGAGTSDPTSMMTQWILFTGSLLILMVMKRKKSNN